MKRKEIEKKKAELDEILRETDDRSRLEKLKILAREVGASVTRIEPPRLLYDPRTGRRVGQENSRNVITETEIVHNIQVALQTETMIDMPKTAARNWIIAVIASIVGFLSMVAAWVSAMAARAR